MQILSRHDKLMPVIPGALHAETESSWIWSQLGLQVETPILKTKGLKVYLSGSMII